MDNVKIQEPLGNSDHNQMHFDIKVKSESKKKIQKKLPQREISRYEKILSKARFD